jgi:hypothetical protein
MKHIKNSSNGVIWLFLITALVVMGMVSGQLIAKTSSIAKITFYTGQVEVQKAMKNDWSKALFNQSLLSGQKVKTQEESRAEIGFADGSIIRIDGNSKLDIIDAKKEKSGAQTATAKVWSGKVWANVNKMSKKTKFQLESPTAVAAVRGTVYRMAVSDDQTTKIAVYSGEVAVDNKPIVKFMEQKKAKAGGKQGEIEGPSQISGPSEVSLEQWVQIVKAQMEITIHPDGTYDIVNFNPIMDSQDDWVRWNQERDKKLGINRE